MSLPKAKADDEEEEDKGEEKDIYSDHPPEAAILNQKQSMTDTMNSEVNVEP